MPKFLTLQARSSSSSQSEKKDSSKLFFRKIVAGCFCTLWLITGCAGVRQQQQKPELLVDHPVGPLGYTPPMDYPEEMPICLGDTDPQKCGIFFPKPLDSYLASFARECIIRTKFQSNEIERLNQAIALQQDYLATLEDPNPWYYHAAMWGTAGTVLGILTSAWALSAVR